MGLDKLLGLAALGTDLSPFADEGTIPTSSFLMGGGDQGAPNASQGDDSILQMILGMSQRGPSSAELEDPFADTEAVNKGWTPMNGYGDANPTYGMAPPEEPSLWQLANEWYAPIDQAVSSPLGKLGLGGLGALIASYGAKRQNNLYKQSAQDALNAKAAAKAQYLADTAPIRVTNNKAALPSWGANQQNAFGGNSLAAMTPRSTSTMYAADGGPVDGYSGGGNVEMESALRQLFAQKNPGYAVSAPRSTVRHGFVAGGTAGQADKIPAMLSDGEYVMDADSVSALGDGNNAAGASALDQMRQNIRKHKRAAPINKIPPKARAPEAYLKGAK